ncbi:MAG: Cdc6/Cdc18 family protein [Phycisphaerae bacterium]
MRWDIEAGKQRIIVDADSLSPESTPSRLVGREAELATLTGCLQPMRHGERPLNAWLCGPPGSGKSLLAHAALERVGPAAPPRAGVYVNCWQRRSLYNVLQAIIDQLKILSAEAQDANVKFDRIRQALGGQATMIVLDDIDRTLPAARDEIIYGLLSLPKAGLVCVADSMRALVLLEERVRSRLSPVVIELKPYTTAELVKILADRAHHGLMPHSWSSAVLKRIAAASGGDARVAIRKLLQAAVAAEEAGQRRLDVRWLATQLRQWNHIQEEARSIQLSEHERIIRELVTRHGPVGTIRLRELYVAHCRKEGIEPVARRTFSKYLVKLNSAGLLRVAARPPGRGGRTVRAA